MHRAFNSHGVYHYTSKSFWPINSLIAESSSDDLRSPSEMSHRISTVIVDETNTDQIPITVDKLHGFQPLNITIAKVFIIS